MGRCPFGRYRRHTGCTPVHRLTITIRTANRAPRRNYLGRTVRSLIAHGVAAEAIHLVLTDPDDDWIDEEVGSHPVVRHVPNVRRTPNANGLAQIAVLDEAPAEWLLMLEDDIDVCDDFPGSVLRWLDRHARPEVHVYRFCAFGGALANAPGVAIYPLREQRGSQAIALRGDEAPACLSWAAVKGKSWRPRGARFQDQPDLGFDKLIGYWALDRWPTSRVSYVSEPHMVRHIGIESGLYPQTVVNDAQFNTRAWQPEGVA